MAMLLAACATTRPWINQPIAPNASVQAATIIEATIPATYRQRPPSILAAVALSGGGARAAAFGLGVLEELKATRFELDGRDTTLLDEVGVISGVSGGSVLATYYAAFGDEVFKDFERDFLLVNFQSRLIRAAMAPTSLYRLTSPWYGRTDVLAQRLDGVFRGMTFGDLHRQHPHPRLLVTATDLTTGAPFEFTPEQFSWICSDLDSVPLSFAVAASSAVPILLSPVTLRNYAGSCPRPMDAHNETDGDSNLSARLLQLIAQSYLNAADRPYIHLVDGGLVDNLGVRGLLDRAIAAGSLDASFRALPPDSVHQIVLVSVNSERDTADRIDTTDRVPSTPQVLDALVFGAGSRLTTETTEMVNDAAHRLEQELQADRQRPGSPFAADAQIHVITVSLRGLQDASLRRKLLQVPTALTILPIQVRQLEVAGRQAMRESPEFQRLRASLAARRGPGTTSPELTHRDTPHAQFSDRARAAVAPTVRGPG